MQSSDGVDWDKWRRSKAPFENVLGNYQLKIILEFAKGPRILDVACGDGSITEVLANHFSEVVGIDSSEEMIATAKKRIPNASFVVATFDRFNPSTKFDTITMINILEHVDNADLLIQKAVGWLGNNGNIIIQVPNATSLNKRIGVAMGLEKSCYELSEGDKIIGHKIRFDLDMLRNVVEKNGLKITDSGGFLLKPFSNSQMQRIYEMDLWKDENEKKLYFDALFEIGKDIPEYASTIFVNCVKIH